MMVVGNRINDRAKPFEIFTPLSKVFCRLQKHLRKNTREAKKFEGHQPYVEQRVLAVWMREVREIKNF